MYIPDKNLVFKIKKFEIVKPTKSNIMQLVMD